jgi:hypothetical protein
MKTILATAGPGRYFGPIMATTHDGKLACGCDARGDCTCKIARPTRDAKPRLTIGHPAAITISLALQGLSHRLDRVEQIHAANKASQGMTQGGQPQQIIAAAQQKANMHLAQMRAEKIDEMIEDSHQKKADEEEKRLHGEPDAPNFTNEPQGDVDMESHKHGAPLDESCGGNRQATTKFPLGKSRISNDGAYVTAAEAKAMIEAHEREQAARRKAFEHEAATNRKFRDRDRTLIQDMKAQIERGAKERRG